VRRRGRLLLLLHLEVHGGGGSGGRCVGWHAGAWGVGRVEDAVVLCCLSWRCGWRGRTLEGGGEGVESVVTGWLARAR